MSEWITVINNKKNKDDKCKGEVLKCEKCKIYELEDETNLLVVLKKIRTKEQKEIFSYFQEKVKETPDLIFQKNIIYDSNILHEIVYEITSIRADDDKYEKIEKYITLLQYLSTLPEFEYLLNEPNAANDEKPYEVLQRRWFNKSNENKAYQKLANIFQLFTSKKTQEEILRDREAAKLTKIYHQKQRDLFSYFEKKYKSVLISCEKCNTTLDYFQDFPNLSRVIRNDPYLSYIKKLLYNIILFREKCINLFPNNQIKINHQRVLEFFKDFYNLI